MSNGPKSGPPLVGMRRAEYATVPAIGLRAGKSKCDACGIGLRQWAATPIVVYGRCVLHTSCYRGLCGKSDEQEMAAQEQETMAMFRAELARAGEPT